MIKTLKQTISNIYYWIKKKLIQFKKWLVILIFGSAILAAPLVLPPDVPDIALENIQADYHASELKDKYRLEKTAFILDAVDENAIQAEVGNKSLDSFEPSLMLRKWDDEVNFKVKYKKPVEKRLSGRLKDLIVKDRVDLEGNKIKFKSDKTEVHFYDIKKGELLHDKILEHDVYEVEVLLLEKPDTNLVEFDIETQGLAFYYQPELTQEEIDEGALRPENVIKSYAVYHESKTNHILGQKNYMAGKAFHIYRPKIIDSAGTEVWGELNITDNLLTVEIPQEFLDNAVYPVRHAAGLTFGYETLGGSLRTGATAAEMWGSDAESPSDVGTITKMTCGARASSGTMGYKAVLVLESNLNIVTNGVSLETVVSTTKQFNDFTFATDPTLSPSTSYFLATINGAGFMIIYYDIVAGYNVYRDTSNNYNTPTNPTDRSINVSGKRASIYCTYQAGAAARRMFIVD